MRNGHRKLWTPEEDNQLRELIAAGASVTSICAKLTRSPEAIRMRAVRLQKGATSSSNLLTPTPELPDNTLLSTVAVPTRIRNALAAAGITTVGEVREMSDATLMTFPDLGKGSVAELRQMLGLPSSEGVRPAN